MTRIPFHPLLFALFPVMSLFVANSEQLTFLEWLQPAVLVVSLAGILWFAANRWLKDGAKSAIISSILILLFFSFSRVLDAITYELYSIPRIGQRAFVVEGTVGWVLWGGFCLVLFGVALYVVKKSSSDFKILTQFLNIFGVALDTHRPCELVRSEAQRSSCL